VAKVPYRILVPCPEPGGDVTPLAPDEVRWGSAGDLLIDARPLEGSVGSASGVRRVPFDFLDPVSEELLRDLVAVRADRVVVFGDGGLPDSGEELAKELSGRGVRNVFFIRGGVDAIRGHLDAKEVTP
jgi:hypothetical protein